MTFEISVFSLIPLITSVYFLTKSFCEFFFVSSMIFPIDTEGITISSNFCLSFEKNIQAHRSISFIRVSSIP